MQASHSSAPLSAADNVSALFKVPSELGTSYEGGWISEQLYEIRFLAPADSSTLESVSAYSIGCQLDADLKLALPADVRLDASSGR